MSITSLEHFIALINNSLKEKPTIDLPASVISTPLGPMIAIGDDHFIYLLKFMDSLSLVKDVLRLVKKTKRMIIPRSSKTILSIEKELLHYFEGKLNAFTTPLILLGTPFQQQVWQELLKISFGETRSYAAIACALGKPTAFRAVAAANSSNQHPLIIPCHRVIKSNGDLCGYNGGVKKKQWLLAHEKAHLKMI